MMCGSLPSEKPDHGREPQWANVWPFLGAEAVQCLGYSLVVAGNV